jgi:transposase
MNDLDHADVPAIDEYATVVIVFELSKAKWKLGVQLPGSRKLSRYAMQAGDLRALSSRLETARSRAARGGKPVRILSCYEAGWDAHWLHRWLSDQGIISYEVDPSSIEVNRRARQAKTDRIDLDRIMRAFLAYLRGEPRACSMVHVPSVEEEDRKRRNRECDRLTEERTMHCNRINGLLHAQGIRNAAPMRRGFIARLGELRSGDGRPLPPRLLAEITREHERLELVNKQLAALEAESLAECRSAQPGAAEAKMVELAQLKSIALRTAQGLVNEVFYRSFQNRRQVGSYIGLTGTPFDSGQSRREQGISKAGNSRARTLAIELAWRWLNHQPDSELAHWFRARVGNQKGRMRRIAIVALARKLMIALWRYLEHGLVPKGAVLRPSL